MNTAITRIGFLLIPAALALALAPAAAMADELQNGASSTNSSYVEHTQEPLAGEAPAGNEPTPKRQSLQARRQTQALLSLQRQQKMDSCWKTDI